MYAMGIDLGTSSLKALLVDPAGNIQGASSGTYQFDAPCSGYAEQHTDLWWNACRAVVREVLARSGVPALEIKALSFSGQMHGLVMLDKKRQVIRPAILHCDTRSGGELSKIGDLYAALPPFNPVYTGFLLSSLLWVKEYEQEYYNCIDAVCLPKDFLKFKLCGELCSDFSDASATLAFDIEHFRWSAEILNALGIPLSWFPPCVAADATVGTVTKEAAVETGLAAGTLVVSGGGDQVMQAIGNGAIKSGQATVNIGSSGQVCFQSDKPVANPQRSTNTFCAYSKDTWIVMGATMTAGLSFKWYRSRFTGEDYRTLDNEIAILPAGAGGLLFLPYLSGERTPHVNPDLSGAFLGLRLDTGKAHLARAVLEGVAYSLYQCLETCEDLGLHTGELIASGGGARSAVWMQILADVFALPIKTTVTEEQACIGAAAAAFSGGGVFSSIEEACRSMVHYQPGCREPDLDQHRIYQEFYQHYKEAYRGSSKTLQYLTELGRRHDRNRQ
ncbi:MAG: xylulokinase [Treponema sp.]|jgi:xylulokinase|nr:xylulokinase [Treponema sp.]